MRSLPGALAARCSSLTFESTLDGCGDTLGELVGRLTLGVVRLALELAFEHLGHDLFNLTGFEPAWSVRICAVSMGAVQRGGASQSLVKSVHFLERRPDLVGNRPRGRLGISLGFRHGSLDQQVLLV